MESRLPGLKRRSFLPSRKSHVPTTQSQTENLPHVQEPPPQPTLDKTATSKKFLIGDRVCISGVKTGRILYFGKFLLADGLWCGIELDEPVGKHDGEVEGVRYFTAKPGYGIFAPVSKVNLADDGEVVPDSVSQQTEAALKPEKVFRSKLQRRTLHYPKSASQLTRDPEKGSSESISSQSETGSEASSQSLVGSQVKKPKLSFVYKLSSIPRSGQTTTSVCSEGLEKNSGLPKPKGAFGKGIQPPGDYKREVWTESAAPVCETESSALNSTRVLESNQKEVCSEDTSSLANRTQTLTTNEQDALNQTQVIHKAGEPNGQTRAFEKRSQPDDSRTSEQDSKRPRFSELPLSRLPQSEKITAKVTGNRDSLNSTFVSAPCNKDLPVGSKTVKGNDTFSVHDDPEEVEAFSPEVHRQLVAGGRQYLNITFDAEAKESDGGINVTHIVSAKSDDQDAEDLSELDSRIEFLRGDRHVGEATLFGILKPEEMDDTKLIASYLLDGSSSSDPPDQGHKSTDVRHAELSSLGILPSDCLETVDCSNFLADNPRIQALKHHAAGQVFRSRTCSDDFGVMENPLSQRDSRVFSLDSNENFDLTGGVVTSTPLVSNLRRKADSVQESGNGDNDQMPSTPEQLQQERLSSSIGSNLQGVRRNLDLTNNAYQEETDPPGEPGEKDVPAEVGGDNFTEPHSQVDELQNPPVPTSSLTSADAEASSAEMQTSLVLTDLLKADSKPMTDSGIDNVMTASQEMVASQTSDDRRLVSGGPTVLDKLEQVLDERNQLAADLMAGHSKTDRPLSLISSVSSVDTGYVPDTDSERGTLTTNSPSEWPDIRGSQPSDERQKNLTELYADTFQAYQEGVMKGLTLQGCMKDSDVSDVGTLATASGKEKEMESDGSQMNTVCKARDETFEATAEETSETESSIDVTTVSKQEKDQQYTICESSSEERSRETSQEAGEQGMDTSLAVESDSSTCRMGDGVDMGENSENVTKDDQTGKQEKPDSKSKTKGTKSKPAARIDHKKPNINVGSKLAEYLKTAQPSKAKEEGKETVTKAKKNLSNKKKTDISIGKSPLKSEDKDAESKPSPRERVKVVKEPPKIIKRTTPKSKWGDIMSTIEANKDSPPKPKEKVVKSRLESIFSQAPPPRKREPKKVESKVPKKLQSLPKPDYSQVKSRLNTSSQAKASPAARTRTGSSSSIGTSVPLHLDFSGSINGSINDSALSSARSSRSDISGLGHTDLKGRGKQVNNKASLLMKLERPKSASSTRSDDVSMNSVKAMNEKNIQKSPRRKSEIKSSIPPIAPRRPSPAKSSPARSSPARSSPAKSSGKTSEASTSKQSTKQSSSPNKRAQSVSHQNRNKNVKSKTVNNLKSSETEHEKSVKAAEEISRLEALCESRTKELTLLKMQLKSSVTAFDAMTALVNYLTQELDAFSCPVIKGKLDTVLKELAETKTQLSNLQELKTNLEEEIVSLNKQHEAALASVNSEHADKLIEAKKVLTEEHQKKISKVKEKHSLELENLRGYHERHIKEVGLDNDEKTHQLKLAHIEEIRSLQSKHDNQMEELHRQHRDKLEDITVRFESIKMSLSEKVETLRGECDDLRNRARLSEEALHRDTDVKVQMALAPYKNLPQEIESLKLVIDMRNEEIRDLRRQKIETEKQLEELPVARERCISLKQQVENLEAIVNIKTDHEKQLSEKCHLLMKKYEQENKQKKRLSMNVEELMWKMNESGSDFGSTESLAVKRQVSHSPTNSESSDNRRIKSWSSCSETSLSPGVHRRNGDSSAEGKIKRRSGTFLLEYNQSTPTSPNNRNQMSKSFNESMVSACEVSMSQEEDSFDGPHGLPPPPEPQEWQAGEQEVNIEDVRVDVEAEGPEEEEESSVSTSETSTSESGVQESVV
ncbi:uncharacterized protein LOC135472223 isoform X2 [Liolophura sinensis]|uniref:uncharacterized protein LOC135472223 isoform X2 n=1 Tax=Liolophura sinensis TaxID=3198878 RepID=UPI00315856FA